MIPFGPRFVYFMKPVGLDGPIKIGVSIEPVSRLDALATWSPLPLELLVTIPGSVKLEARIHEVFAHAHCHHEWFHAVDALRSLIQKLKAGVPIEQAISLRPMDSPLRRGPNRKNRQAGVMPLPVGVAAVARGLQ